MKSKTTTNKELIFWGAMALISFIIMIVVIKL